MAWAIISLGLRRTSVVFEIDQAGAVFLQKPTGPSIPPGVDSVRLFPQFHQARACRYKASTVQIAEITKIQPYDPFLFLDLVSGAFTNLIRS
jgi:hypothetical protein